MKKVLFLSFLLSIAAFSENFTIDFTRIDPLASAVLRGVEEAFSINEKGLNALEKGDFEEAEECFLRAADMLPIYSDAKNNLGVLYYRTQREEEAQKIWKQVVQKDHEYATAWYNLGLYTVNSGDFAKAGEYFLRAAKEQPDFWRAKIQIARINLVNNKKNEAKKLAAAAYAKAPNVEEIWSLYSYVLAQTGEAAKAIKILEKKVPSAAAVKMLGEIYAVSGDYVKAKTYFESLKINYSPLRDYYESLAAVYNELKMYKKTEELFKEAENMGDKISLSFWISYTWALHEQGQKDRAISILMQKSVQNPDDKDLKAKLIYVLINDKKFDDAKAVLDEMEKADDKNFSIQYLKGFAALNISQYEESKKSLETALKISPNDNAAKGLLAFVLVNLGDTKTAEKLWRESVKSDTLNNQSFINLAVLYEKKNMCDSALIYYKKALKIAENAGVRVSIGNIFLEKKQYDSAIVNYALAHDSSDWRTKALAGEYFAAIGLKDTNFADKVAAFISTSDTGDYVIRVLSDYAYRKGDFEQSEKLSRSISSPIAEDYIRLGWTYLELKNTRSAEIAADSAKFLKANESEISKLRQRIAFAKGDYNSALSFKDDSPSGIYNRAIILYRNKDYSQALNESIIAADLFFGNEKIEMVRIAANSAAAIKNWSVALRWFSLLNKLDPTAQNALNTAIAAYNENNITLTKEFYLSAKEQDSLILNKDIEARLEYEERLKESQETMEIVFSIADSLYNSALNFHLSGDTENAVKLYEELLKFDKNYYRAWNNLGAIYGEQGEFEKAIDSYENAVGKRADIVDGYVNLVNIYSAIDDIDNAKKWLRKGLKVAPKDQNLLFFKKQLGE
ncbi:MAG: tetratricopeptide repeat protein [Chitinispirillales bacterium]|nr:tetratricopeptide repeat protein [Chitinispirillales bacterium]